jgi:hypothetical protein
MVNVGGELAFGNSDQSAQTLLFWEIAHDLF